MKIAVFGSAFNPPSLGHKSVLEQLVHFDRVLLVPSIAHAWGKTMLSYEVRCEMVELFIQDIQLANVQLSLVEEELYQSDIQDHRVTTFAVLEQLQQHNPHAQLTFVLGPDNLLNFSSFYKSKEILAKWSVLACPELIDVRSTYIRAQLNNTSDSHEKVELESLTTPSVVRYLCDKALYQN